MKNKSRISEIADDLKAVGKCFRFVWSKRKTYFIYCVIAAVLSLAVSFSIPKTYSASVVLAPEPQSNSAASSLSNLAAAAGLNMGSMGEDAYTVDLYPTIVSSMDFSLALGDITIKSGKLGLETSYFDYLENYRKSPWWSYPMKWLKKSLKKIKGDDKSLDAKHSDASRYISEKQYALHEVIRSNVSCVVEALSGVISVTVYDQDPEVAVLVADSVVERLNKFILDYRTSKARTEYEYVSALCDEARNKYLNAQEKYAEYARSHSSVYSPANMAELEFLQNEVSLAYSSYSTITNQLQMVQAKIFETTPVYTVIEPAYIPLFADSPKKLLMMVIFVFLAIVAATARLLYVELYRKNNDRQ